MRFASKSGCPTLRVCGPVVADDSVLSELPERKTGLTLFNAGTTGRRKTCVGWSGNTATHQ